MFVIARSAPEVLVVAIETMSLAVAGEMVVEALDQKPTVPDPPIVPVQSRFPAEPESVMVQSELPAESKMVIVPPSATATRVVVSLKSKLVSQPEPI